MRAHTTSSPLHRKSKRGEFLTRPDYFCDFWLESGLCGTIYSAGDLLGYQRQRRDFHGTSARQREMPLRYRATRRLDLKYVCGKRATGFYGISKQEIRYNK